MQTSLVPKSVSFELSLKISIIDEKFILPVDADGDEVEYGGGGADDVHRDVEVAQHEGQGPKAVNLWTKVESFLLFFPIGKS